MRRLFSSALPLPLAALFALGPLYGCERDERGQPLGTLAGNKESTSAGFSNSSSGGAGGMGGLGGAGGGVAGAGGMGGADQSCDQSGSVTYARNARSSDPV